MNRRAALFALLLVLGTGCRAAPVAPSVPDRPRGAPGGEQGVLLDQLHRLAAEDARAGPGR